MAATARPRRHDDDRGIYGLPGDVSPWDVRFDPRDRAFMDREPDGRFRLRVWTEPALADARLVVRSGRQIESYPMTAVAASGRFTFWEAVAGPFGAGTEYSFAFRAGGGRGQGGRGQGVYLSPAGITVAIERLDRWRFPDSAEELAPLAVPAWARGAVIYQIFPDRFADGDRSVDPPDVRPWGTAPQARGFWGGDLAGIAARLDYLTRLGVEAIYLTPIFASPSNHRYDTVDYLTVDPLLGGNDALRALVDAAHEAGMRVVLDVSINHVHPRFFAFADVVRNGSRSEFRDWFVIEEWPLRIRYRPHVPAHRSLAEWLPVWRRETGLPIEEAADAGPAVEPTYEAWYGVPTMPRVNLANPQARSYLLQALTGWIRDYGIDGWRLDVARYVDPDVWRDLRPMVRAVKPDTYLLGEVMGDASVWLQGDAFDASMNYPLRELAVRFFAAGTIDGRQLADGLARLWAGCAWPVAQAAHNLIGSHDTPRFLTLAGGEVWRLRLAVVLQMTFPGAPGLYYGDEVGMTGGGDPGCRGTFPWPGEGQVDAGAPDPERHPLFRTAAELAALRRTEPALRTGEWRAGEARGSLVTFERRLGRRRLLVAINRGRTAAAVELGSARARLLWGGGEACGGGEAWGGGEVDGGRLRVAGRAAAIVRL